MSSVQTSPAPATFEPQTSRRPALASFSQAAQDSFQASQEGDHYVASQASQASQAGRGNVASAQHASKPAATSPLVSTQSTPHTFEVVKRLPTQTWAWNELLHDPDPHFRQNNYSARQTLRDADLLAAFGTPAPPSSDVVLHYAGDPPPGVPKHPVPVLLVHGASKNGNFWWDPKEDGSNQGLPQYLKSQGYQVYAVSFPDSQDDNFVWEQQTANAIARIKQLTGAPQVDLVGHSKGGVPVRAYVSDFHQDWMDAYRGDVRRAVFVASALGGIDYSFRHPVCNYALLTPSDDPHLNAPISWDAVATPAGFVDTRNVGFGKDGPDYWPGQRQLLARWRDVYPLEFTEPDWYTTYEGGQGFVSQSSGIDHFIEESGNFMPALSAAKVAPSVDVAVLAGNNPNIPKILNEFGGPSDGLLFVKSATDLPADTRVVAETVLPLNHKAVTQDASAFAWIDGVLGADTTQPLTPEQRQAIEDQGLREGAQLLQQAKILQQSSPDSMPPTSPGPGQPPSTLPLPAGVR